MGHVKSFMHVANARNRQNGSTETIHYKVVKSDGYKTEPNSAAQILWHFPSLC
jgi:hypothetical protein